MPDRYRSVFTGAEIDALLASIKTKIDQSLIKNDFTGGEGYVASAEVVKTLNDAIVNLQNPNFFKALLLSLTDNNIYTTAEKQKLASVDLSVNKAASLAAPVTFSSHASIVTPNVPKLVFVTVDETNSNAPTLYFFDGSSLHKISMS